MTKSKKKTGGNSKKRSSPLYLILTLLIVIAYWYFNSESDATNDYIAPNGSIVVHYIDVGQGDSTLICAPNGECMLIDAGTGEAEDDLNNYLKSQNITNIKYAIFTHPHEDHIGGADMVVREYNVENVLMPDVTANTSVFERLITEIEAKNTNVIVPAVGDTYYLGELSFTILGPCETKYSSLNNYSIALRINFGKARFLFTGDAEELSESEILAENSSAVACDVLHVGHHGSSTSTSDSFLAAASPSIAVISCGKDNSYGHPHNVTLEKLNGIQAIIYRTDLEGTIVLSSDGESIFKYE